MEKKDLRIVFMGTPEFAVETLRTLVENKYNVVAVVTQRLSSCMPRSKGYPYFSQRR